MAKVNILLPFILAWEGGFACRKNDKGGATNKGVTLTTWKSVGYDKDGDGDIDAGDLRLLTDADVRDKVLKPHYWDRWQADSIRDQSIANLVVDWLWTSGKYGIIYPQQVLGVKADGIVGPQTIAAINSYRNSVVLFSKLWARRKQHFNAIAAKDPTQKVFLKGWCNRLEGIAYGSLTYTVNGKKKTVRV
ncbi:MAG: peptidoglycan domain protein [Bacteroidales bacterium]|nr:peptidoglycan domain protein [Bacteroidales bacterium]MCM1148182.1 peptidoglycan domain protein [Bacteroidales bacterium]MCM1207091.1 peptidoglycan domain protein [Bacillota bacterium]MCM1510835.1 hypothetical protein [Clostridium sp.]